MMVTLKNSAVLVTLCTGRFSTCPTFARWSVELAACNLHVPTPDKEINSLIEGIRKWYKKNVGKFWKGPNQRLTPTEKHKPS